MKKGYLGPIGDDFPAIFPIAIGLMLFFGSITIVYTDYKAKKDTVNLMRSNIVLSKAIRSQITFDEEYFWGTNQKGGVCNLLDKTKANYGVRAKMEIWHYWYEGTRFKEEQVRFSGRKAECGDLKDDSGNALPYEHQFSVKMVYPIMIEVKHVGSVPDEYMIRSLVITTWSTA